MFNVYSILDCYIGLTNDIERRTKEHIYHYHKGQDKDLYTFLRQQKFNVKFKLKLLRSFKSRTEAKRYEMLLILKDHFTKQKLKQTIPSITG